MPSRIALLALSIALATPAAASDGAFEINQACVASGCLKGDAPGFPVTLAVSGSYRMTSDIVVDDAHTRALAIGADVVHLDLGGFAVRGPVRCEGAEPACAPAGFGDGIATSTHGLVLRNRLVNNGGMGITDGVCGDDYLALNGSGQESCKAEVSTHVCGAGPCP